MFQSSFTCSKIRLCVPELIYVFQNSFMFSRVHLCFPEFFYVFQSSFTCFRVYFMCLRVNLCVPEFIYVFQSSFYVFQSSFMCFRVYLCVPDSRMPFCFPDCFDVFHFSFSPCITGKCRSLPFIRKCPRNLIKDISFIFNISTIYRYMYSIYLQYIDVYNPDSQICCNVRNPIQALVSL